MKNEILKKIQTKDMTAAVIGLGYVGLPLAMEYALAGYKTLGFDVHSEKVEQIQKGISGIRDIDDSMLQSVVKQGLLTVTDDFRHLTKADFIAICVPTPLDRHQMPDISHVKHAAEEIAKHLTKGTVVVLESTTYPGTTEELLKPILETSGLRCGIDFYLGFSPERVDPGNPHFHTKNTPKVVGAIGRDASDTISTIYRTILNSEIYEVSSPAVAEMEKILENTYRNINIGLANEMAMLCHRMNIDYWEVVEAAKTKPYGFQAFYPGPGLGGHCIPLDPYYLSWKAREYGFHTSMIETSMIINDRMPSYCVERAMEILNRKKKPLNGADVLVLGVAYKSNINDYRESPAIKMINGLQKAGAKVDFFDPYIPYYTDEGREWEGLTSIDGTVIGNYDLVIIATAHSDFDYNMIQKHAQAVFDTRNGMKDICARENVEKL